MLWLNTSHLKDLMYKIPEQPKNSLRIILDLKAQGRIDGLLLEAIKAQDRHAGLKAISRRAYKELFRNKRIVLKGQPAVPSSMLAAGLTYVDILGYNETSEQ